MKAKLKSGSTLKGLFSSIQTAINYASSNYTVEIQTGTFNENITVYGQNYLTIIGTGYYSTYLTGTLSFYYCNNLQIWSLNAYQINAYYCNNAYFYNDINGSASQTGIGLYYCTNFYCNTNVYDCNTGINAPSSRGCACGNYSNNNTSVSSSASANVQVSLARLCESVNYDFSVTSSGYISSYSSHFRNAQPRIYNSGGTTAIGSTLSCLEKRSAKIVVPEDFTPTPIQSTDPVETEFSTVNTSYFTLLKAINKEAKENGVSNNEDHNKQFLDIADSFKTFIKKNPRSSLTKVSLTTAVNSYSLFEDNNGMKSFLDEIINNKDLVGLKGTAENLMIEYYRNIKDFDNAIITADAVIQNYKSDDDLLCNALFKKGMILSHETNQPEKAAGCFLTIVQNYPNNSLSEFAKNQLSVLGNGSKEAPKESQSDKITGFTTGVYPNPFNPTTTINYSIPEDGRVSIKVFDILGREITTLLDGFNNAGKHNIMWNGSSQASGIYFYGISFKGQTLYKKMLLVK